MALASTRPVVQLAENIMRRAAQLGGCTTAAWWTTILIVAPLLGSLITEAAAMTIGALLLARQFFDLRPSASLRYATLGLLFVNVSIGGTLTHFAAPPVLDGGRRLGLGHAVHAEPLRLARRLGDRAVNRRPTTCSSARSWRRSAARRTCRTSRSPAEDAAIGRSLLPVPAWVTLVHVAFMAWAVVNRALPGVVHWRLPVLPRVHERHRRYQSAARHQDAAAGRVLPRGPRRPRRAAGLVDRARAFAACPRSRCSGARRSSPASTTTP